MKQKDVQKWICGVLLLGVSWLSGAPQSFVETTTRFRVLPEVTVYEQRRGWIAVDAQDRLLAFSEAGRWQEDQITLHLLQLCAAVDSQHETIWQWPRESQTTSGGWLSTTWHQEAPFNNACPRDPQTLQRCPVGCVALALAQTVNYFQDIGSFCLQSSDGYATNQFTIDSDSSRWEFPSFSRLNPHLDSIRSTWTQNQLLSEAQIAALNFACGIVAETDYQTDISTSQANIATLLQDRLGYASATRRDYSWVGLHAAKIDVCHQLPAILVLANHAAIMDGYRSDGFFHINYGWGASNPTPIRDAWFRLDPHSHSMVVKYLVTDIFPNPEQQPDLYTHADMVGCPAFQTGEYSNAAKVFVKNKTNVVMDIDAVLAPDLFQVSLDGTEWSDALNSLTIAAADSLPLFWRYCAKSSDSLRADAFVVYDQRRLALPIALLGHLAPTRGRVVQGSVSGQWHIEDSPINVVGDVCVKNRLDIEPGVEVVFRGPYKLIVKNDAQLVAKGTATDSIRFRPLEVHQPWRGINIFASGSDDTLAYGLITGGHSLDWGGGLWIADSSPFVAHCRIVGNHAQDGGGVYLWKASPVIKNCLFARNSAERGGGVYAEWSSAPQFINVTLAENQARESGSALYSNVETNATFLNSIVWGNGKTAVSLGSSDRLAFDYCNVDTTAPDWLIWRRQRGQSPVWGAGMLCRDPQWQSDFALTPDSPCVDAGHPSADFNEPLTGHGEPQWPALGTAHNDLGWSGGPPLSVGVSTNIASRANTVERFKLKTFPNPFNAATRFTFSVVQAGEVELAIYAVNGQHITTLLSDDKQPGVLRITWNAENLPSGCYFARLQTPDYTSVCKLIHLK